MRLANSIHFRDLMRGLSPAKTARLVAALTEEEARAADQDWHGGWAHTGQGAPPGDWRTWVVMAGRGFGKTRAGAEWIASAVRHSAEPLRVALVAASFDEARRVMIEGESGLLKVADDCIEDWAPSRRLLRFVGGGQAELFSGGWPQGLRGPEHHLAWCDELAKWQRGQDTWDMLQLGLRLGASPQVLVTTTPRPCQALHRILAGPRVLTIGRTHDNPHLPPAFVAAVTSLYAGTRLARQELDGELLPDIPGALWTVELLEKCRAPTPHSPTLHSREGGNPCTPLIPDAPGTPDPLIPSLPPTPLIPSDVEGRTAHPPAPFTRTVIGVDPPSGDGTCGIIACARDAAGIGHVLADHSVPQ